MMLEREDDVFYTEETLHFYDCDCYNRAKLSTILRYIADVAGYDYTVKGFDHQTLWDQGMVFLLSRTNLAIERMPATYEKVTVSTWEREKKGSQFLRDVEIHDASGQRIVSAATAWLLVNPNSRRILRPEVFRGFMPKRADKQTGCADPKKLRMPEGAALVGKRTIRFSDIDGNGHLYNAIYGDIACDFTPRELLKKPLRGFSINYQAEALLDETLDIYCAPDPEAASAVYIEGKNAAGGNCFLCRLEF